VAVFFGGLLPPCVVSKREAARSCKAPLGRHLKAVKVALRLGLISLTTDCFFQGYLERGRLIIVSPSACFLSRRGYRIPAGLVFASCRWLLEYGAR
jgi:hypothetical protein